MEKKQDLREALDVINKAAVSQKDELIETISESYTNLKNVFEGGHKKISEKIKEQREFVGEKALELDQRVHENPWPYIGGVGACVFVLGFLLGNHNKVS